MATRVIGRQSVNGVARLAIGALGWLLSATCSWASVLSLDFIDTDGREVEVAGAELLLVAWGETKRLDLATLATSGSGLNVDLEPDWLRSRWSRFDDQHGVFLYLQAPPLAPIRSYRFVWPGAGEDVEDTTQITFPGNQAVTVARGANASLTLTFRPRVGRRVRIVDPGGTPLTGGQIDVSMFWSQFNHCGYLAGADPLGSYSPDAEGLIEVPDGDFEYVLALSGERWRNHMFADGRVRMPLRTYLTEQTTDIVVRELVSRPLEMAVRRDIEPVQGIRLVAYLANCCGSCHGTLATTDETGRLHLPAFRPERYWSVWLESESGESWDTAPASWPTDVVEVDLSSRAADGAGH